MACSPDIKAEITDRLAELWVSSTWATQRSIGELIADAFCTHLRDSVKSLLTNKELLHSGLGKIVNRVGDDALTEWVLQGLVRSSKKHLLNLADLQESVNRIAETAFEFYIEHSKVVTESDEDAEDLETEIACLIEHLDTKTVPENKLINAASDKGLSLSVRLAAFLKSNLPIDEEIESLLESALEVESMQPRSTAVKIISKQADAGERFQSILTAPKWSAKDRENLLDYVPAASHPDLLWKLFRSPQIDLALRLRPLVFAARHGDRKAMDLLLADMSVNPSEIVNATMSIFGHYRSQELARVAFDAISKRDWPLAERSGLASSISLGMTAVFEMDWFQSGGLEYCPLHPGTHLFESFLESWSATSDFTALEALSYDRSLANMGFEKARGRLLSRIQQVVNTPGLDLKDWSNAHSIGHALSFLRRQNRLPSIDLVSLIIDASSHNALMYCYDILADIGTYEALDRLLSAYNDTESEAKGCAFDAIERLAGRLGVHISNTAGVLEMK